MPNWNKSLEKSIDADQCVVAVEGDEYYLFPGRLEFYKICYNELNTKKNAN